MLVDELREISKEVKGKKNESVKHLENILYDSIVRSLRINAKRGRLSCTAWIPNISLDYIGSKLRKEGFDLTLVKSRRKNSKMLVSPIVNAKKY